MAVPEYNTSNFKKLLALGLLVLMLFIHVLRGLVKDWWVDPNYSHGFLIPLIFAYLLWSSRGSLASLRLKPLNWGLLVITFSLFVLFAGYLGAELFLQRISLVLLIIGIIMYLAGNDHLKMLATPVGLLVLMIPLPSIIFYQITFPLQLFASGCATKFISFMNLPVLREGNIIHLTNTSLAVVEACSGIRSLITLITLGSIVAYFTQTSSVKRILIILLTVPIAVIANALRVTIAAVLAHYFGSAAAENFFHGFSGWAIFLIALMFIFLVAWLLSFLNIGNAGKHEDSERGETHELKGDYRLSNLRLTILIGILTASIVLLNTVSRGEPRVLVKPLEQFPYQIGSWKGDDIELDARTLEVLHTRDYLNRIYRPGEHDKEPVMLYMAYYPSQRQGETMHSPKNCLPGSGWEVEESGLLKINLHTGRTIFVNKYLVKKGTERTLVFYWYQSQGRITTSEYWSKVYLVADAVSKNRTDGALVRVSLAVKDSLEDSIKEGAIFVKDIFPKLSDFIPE